MAENKIFTRIQLKYDSYTAWEAVKETFKPLQGEMCVVNPGTNLSDAAKVPCLLKVGDGEHFWKDLPWISATAADVYAWGKAKELAVVEESGKQYLRFTDAAGAKVKDVDLSVFATEAEVEAITGKLTDLTTDTKTTLVGAINELDTAINTVDAKVGNKDDLTTTAKTAVGAINEHDTEIGDLTKLSTTNKGDLVTAINEVRQSVEVGGTGSVVTVTKEITPTAGSEVTYTVKQGGNAVDVKIEIPKYDTEADYGVLKVEAGTGIEITGDDDQNPTINVKANTYDAYGAAATVQTGVENGTIKAKSAELADSATTAEKVAKKLTVGTKNYDGSTEVTVTAADLGLESAMHFVGALTEAPATAKPGDVYLNTATKKEYVYSTEQGWVELGDEGSHALKSIKIEGEGYLTGGGDLSADRKIDITAEVKAKIDDIANKADKVTGATAGNFAGLDENGNLTDSGKKATDFKTVQEAKDNYTGSTVKTVTSVKQNENGEITEVKFEDIGKIANAGHADAADVADVAKKLDTRSTFGVDNPAEIGVVIKNDSITFASAGGGMDYTWRADNVRIGVGSGEGKGRLVVDENSNDGTKQTTIEGATVTTEKLITEKLIADTIHLEYDIGGVNPSIDITGNEISVTSGQVVVKDLYNTEAVASLTSNKLTVNEAAIGGVEIKSNETATGAVKYLVFNCGSATVLVD